MQLILTITNNTSKIGNVTLFDSFGKTYVNGQKKDAVPCNLKGLPCGYDVKVVVKEPNKPDLKINYNHLLAQLSLKPEIVNVSLSTNNRQLYFYYIHPSGGQWPMEPCLAKNKTHRLRKKSKKFFYFETEYRSKWNPDKWNIADTNEDFLLDFKFLLIIKKLLPKQPFQIIFEFSKTKKINHIFGKDPEITFSESMQFQLNNPK